MLLAVFLLSLSCEKTESNVTYETREYNVYMRGNLAGTHSSKLTENGDYQYSFNFNDRGRGPEIEQRHTNLHHQKDAKHFESLIQRNHHSQYLQIDLYNNLSLLSFHSIHPSHNFYY